MNGEERLNKIDWASGNYTLNDVRLLVRGLRRDLRQCLGAFTRPIKCASCEAPLYNNVKRESLCSVCKEESEVELS